MPKMTLIKGIYHWENQKIHREFQHLFKADHSSSFIVPLRLRFREPVAVVVDRVVLHWGHTRLIMCNYGGVGQQINRKSILRITCIYRQCSHSLHVRDALQNKSRKILSNYWVSTKTKYYLKHSDVASLTLSSIF